MAERQDEQLIDYEHLELEDHSAAGLLSSDVLKQGASGIGGAAAYTEHHLDQRNQLQFAGIHSTGFKDFLLKPDLMKAITDCGFEHPSEVQQECIPQSIMGVDVLCQAKSGMGKTAVFVLTTLHQLEDDPSGVSVLVMCHTRELAFQIKKEFERFTKHMSDKVSVYPIFGGEPIQNHIKRLKTDPPTIVVGTPGRILALVRSKNLDLSKLKHFVLDECDKMLEALDMRRDVQAIFKMTPHQKQVQMFSATLNAQMRATCKKFMKQPFEIAIDNETGLTLHGLKQFFCKLNENEKNRKLIDLLDALQFNQVVIFVKTTARADALNKLLTKSSFPSMCIHSGIEQSERINRFELFKNFKKRIMVATDIFGRGIDIERVNIVFNYDMPDSSDQYLHRVGRAGRFGTKGLAVSMISTEDDETVLTDTQRRFEVKIENLPESIDSSTYMNQ